MVQRYDGGSTGQPEAAALTSHAPPHHTKQMRLLAGMLGLSPWRYLPLTLQLLSEEHAKTWTGGSTAADHACVARCSKPAMHS